MTMGVVNGHCSRPRRPVVPLVILGLSILVSSCATRTNTPNVGNYFPDQQAVVVGKVVRYHGLAFTVPASWRVLPGRRYGDCVVTGPAIVVGSPATNETCSASLTVGNPFAPTIQVLRMGSWWPGSMSVKHTETTTVHGVSMTIEGGWSVRTGLAVLGSTTTTISRSAIITWPLAAKFAGYDVALSATAQAPLDASPAVAYRTIMAILLSVRPSGTEPSASLKARSRSAIRAQSVLLRVLTSAKRSFALAHSTFSGVSPVTLHASDPGLRFVLGANGAHRSSDTRIISIDAFSGTGGLSPAHTDAFAAAVWDPVNSRCYGVLDIETPMFAWYSGKHSAALSAVSGIRAIQGTPGFYSFTGTSSSSCYADAIITTAMRAW